MKKPDKTTYSATPKATALHQRADKTARAKASRMPEDLESQSPADALRESEEKFSKAFQTSPYAITITRPESGALIEVNDAFISMSGYSRAEATKESSISLKMWVDEKNRDEVVSTLGAGREVVGKEFLFRKKNGEVFSGLFSAKVININNTPCILSTINDITEPKRVEEALQQEQLFSKSIIDSLPNIFFLYSYPECKLVGWNKRHETDLGYTSDELKDRHVMDFHAPENNELIMTAIKTVMESGCGSAEDLLVTKDGRKIPYSSTATRLESKGKLYFMGICEDISERKRAEEALRASETRFKTMFDEAPLGIALIDSLTGHIYSLNPMFAKIAGRTMEEMAHIDWMSITHPDDVQEDLDNMALMNAGKVPEFKMEKRYLHPDGTPVWINMTIAPIYVEDKAQPRHLCMIEDITKRKEIEAGLEKTRQELAVIKIAADEISELAENVINTVREPLIALDQDLRVVKVSSSFYEFFRAEPENTVGQLIYDLGNKQWDIPKLRELLETILPQKATFDNYEVERDFATIGRRTMLLNARQIQRVLGKERIILLAIEDITERKRAEDKLRGVLAELERSNKDLEQFASIASHDLQEPLRMVASYTQLLADRYEGQLDQKARKYITYAVEGAIRMQRLVNDLLTYSRVSTRGNPLESTDSHSIFGEAIRNLAAMIEESKAIVTNEELPMVRADASQLMQVFQNLFTNAIKFRGGNFPHIHVSARDEGCEWVFSVRDNGIGIDRKYADRIFVIFQRLHTRQEYPGTGIGLAVCKRIVERHGGRIWFESEPGEGSTFFFTVPK